MAPLLVGNSVSSSLPGGLTFIPATCEGEEGRH